MKSFCLSIALIVLCYSQLFGIETLEPNILRVAVTEIPHTQNGESHWSLDFLKKFESLHHIQLEFVVVPFDKSWELAAQGKVDLVATGVSALKERQVEGATFSKPYLQVKRGLRIHAKDQGIFHTLNDFVGYKIGSVEGMTATQDLYNRAPDGVEIVLYDSWSSMYKSFYQNKIDAIAEGYYVSNLSFGFIFSDIQRDFGSNEDIFFEGNSQMAIFEKKMPSVGPKSPEDQRDKPKTQVSLDTTINHNNPDYPMIDPHDLVEGNPEYLVFVVRDASVGVLEAINHLLDTSGFPIRNSS